eukprot:g6769.t1
MTENYELCCFFEESRTRRPLSVDTATNKTGEELLRARGLSQYDPEVGAYVPAPERILYMQSCYDETCCRSLLRRSTDGLDTKVTAWATTEATALPPSRNPEAQDAPRTSTSPAIAFDRKTAYQYLLQLFSLFALGFRDSSNWDFFEAGVVLPAVLSTGLSLPSNGHEPQEKRVYNLIDAGCFAAGFSDTALKLWENAEWDNNSTPKPLLNVTCVEPSWFRYRDIQDGYMDRKNASLALRHLHAVATRPRLPPEGSPSTVAVSTKRRSGRAVIPVSIDVNVGTSAVGVAFATDTDSGSASSDVIDGEDIEVQVQNPAAGEKLLSLLRDANNEDYRRAIGKCGSTLLRDDARSRVGVNTREQMRRKLEKLVKFLAIRKELRDLVVQGACSGRGEQSGAAEGDVGGAAEVEPQHAPSIADAADTLMQIPDEILEYAMQTSTLEAFFVELDHKSAAGHALARKLYLTPPEREFNPSKVRGQMMAEATGERTGTGGVVGKTFTQPELNALWELVGSEKLEQVLRDQRPGGDVRHRITETLTLSRNEIFEVLESQLDTATRKSILSRCTRRVVGGVTGFSVVHAALGSREGQGMFTCSGQQTGKLVDSSTSATDEEDEDCGPNRKHEVTIRTLDGMFASESGHEGESGEILFLKVDAEGHDEEIVRGSHTLLRRKMVRYLLFEVNFESAAAMEQFLEFLGSTEMGYPFCYAVMPDALFPLDEQFFYESYDDVFASNYAEAPPSASASDDEAEFLEVRGQTKPADAAGTRISDLLFLDAFQRQADMDQSRQPWWDVSADFSEDSDPMRVVAEQIAPVGTHAFAADEVKHGELQYQRPSIGSVALSQFPHASVPESTATSRVHFHIFEPGRYAVRSFLDVVTQRSPGKGLAHLAARKFGSRFQPNYIVEPRIMKLGTNTHDSKFTQQRLLSLLSSHTATAAAQSIEVAQNRDGQNDFYHELARYLERRAHEAAPMDSLWLLCGAELWYVAAWRKRGSVGSFLSLMQMGWSVVHKRGKRREQEIYRGRIFLWDFVEDEILSTDLRRVFWTDAFAKRTMSS